MSNDNSNKSAIPTEDITLNKDHTPAAAPKPSEEQTGSDERDLEADGLPEEETENVDGEGVLEEEDADDEELLEDDLSEETLEEEEDAEAEEDDLP